MTKWIERYRAEAEARFRRLDDLLDRMDDDTTQNRPTTHQRRGRVMNAAQHRQRQATIEADPNLPTITITREFDHPPAKVFRAFTDRDLFVQWIGPRSVDTRIDHWDCRTGGGYRYASVARRVRGEVLRLLPRGASRRAPGADVHVGRSLRTASAWRR